MKQKYKTKWKPLQQIRTSRRQTLEFEDKMEIKGKAEELLVKQLKIYKRKMQELTHSTKRPNMSIMSIEEREQLQSKRDS
jgi:hypothetical protein